MTHQQNRFPQLKTQEELDQENENRLRNRISKWLSRLGTKLGRE